MKIDGQHSWIDIYSEDADETLAFLNKTLGIKEISMKNEKGVHYKVIKAAKGVFPFAGIMQITQEQKDQGLFPHATIYLTVNDYDAMHDKFVESGAKVQMSHSIVDKMKFGIYVIPGGTDIGIVQYGVKSK